MTAFVRAEQAFELSESAVAAVDESLIRPIDPQNSPTVTPSDILDFLARLRMLSGVPFGYLVPDADLLPPESIRFFYLDRNWTDALVQGALSVGTVNSVDRAQLEALYSVVREEVDEAERSVRVPGTDRLTGPAGAVSGFLLRSRAVSGWPGLHVRAYREALDGPADAEIPETDPRRLKMLRLERLAPAVLLALFDGVPQEVHIEEPRTGIQFGVRLESTDTDGVSQAKLPVRDAATGLDLPDPSGATSDAKRTVDVPFRGGSPGVLDIQELAARLAGVTEANFDQSGGPVEIRGINSAEFALQMLRFPYREIFGDPDTARSGEDDPPIFRPQVNLDEIRERINDIDLRIQ